MSWISRSLLALGGSALFFYAAVVGEGSWKPFFTDPPLAALAWVTLAVAIAALFAGGNVSRGVREDRGNRWVLTAFGIFGFLSAFVPAYTDRIGFWTIDGDAVRWCDVVLYALGSVLRLWPVMAMGNRFSGLVAIQKDHTLVTTGIYRYIRHPSYAGMMLLTGGWALSFRSGVGLVLVALIMIPLVARIRSEEALLRSHFGEEYEAYCRRTTRFIPGVI